MENFQFFKKQLLNGNTDGVKNTLCDEFMNKNMDEKYMKYPIHVACQRGYTDIVNLFLERNCNVECENIFGWRAIHYGCKEGYTNIVNLLLESNCNVECETNKGWRPIHYGCIKGHVEIIRLLIHKKCQINCKTQDGKTPFDLAQENNYPTCMELLIQVENLLKFFASIKADDVIEFGKLYNSYNLATREYATGLSMLEVALQYKADKIIKHIIEKAIHDTEISDLTKALKDFENVETAHLIKECILYRCILHHHAEGFKKFNTADIINGRRRIVPSSFLEIAAEHGCGAFINEIMKKTIYEKETWKKAMNKAKQNEFQQIEEEISDRIILLESRREVNFSILHSAICDNDVDMMKYILDNPNLVDPNSNNEIFGTSLALAHSLHHKKCINILEQYQVDPNTQNKFLQTPLHEAIASGMRDNCKYLIDRALDIDKTGFMGFTGLHCAVIRGLIDICAQLVNRGADCVRNIEFTHQSFLTDTVIKSIKSMLPLSNCENALTLSMKIHGTLFPCFLDILDANKSNVCDGEKNSLLHMAVKCLQPDICRSLLKAGAVVDKVNNEGNTSLLELLCNMDNNLMNDNWNKMIKVLNVLIEYGADINMKSFNETSIFQAASNYQSEELMLALVAKNPELNELSKNNFRLVFTNKWFDYAEILLKVLPANFLLLNITDKIFQLCMNAPSKLIKLLYTKSNTDLQQSVVEGILYRAAINDDNDLFDHLLNTEILLPKVMNNGEHLLTILLKENKTSFVWKLLTSKNKRKYVNLKNRNNQIPLQIAIEIEEMELINALIHETDEFNCEDFGGKTPLIQLLEQISICNDIPLRNKIISIIKTIISEGGDIYMMTSRGQQVIDTCTQIHVKTDIKQFSERKTGKLGAEIKQVKEEDKGMCSICLNSFVNYTFQCGHLFCNECSDKMHKCPTCKAVITNRIQIYLS